MLARLGFIIAALLYGKGTKLQLPWRGLWDGPPGPALGAVSPNANHCCRGGKTHMGAPTNQDEQPWQAIQQWCHHQLLLGHSVLRQLDLGVGRSKSHYSSNSQLAALSSQHLSMENYGATEQGVSCGCSWPCHPNMGTLQALGPIWPNEFPLNAEGAPLH